MNLSAEDSSIYDRNTLRKILISMLGKNCPLFHDYWHLFTQFPAACPAA
jgi:hypothetical protein